MILVALFMLGWLTREAVERLLKNRQHSLAFWIKAGEWVHISLGHTMTKDSLYVTRRDGKEVQLVEVRYGLGGVDKWTFGDDGCLNGSLGFKDMVGTENGEGVKPWL